VSWNDDVLSESMLHERVSSTTVQLSSQRSRHVEVTYNDEPTLRFSTVPSNLCSALGPAGNSTTVYSSSGDDFRYPGTLTPGAERQSSKNYK